MVYHPYARRLESLVKPFANVITKGALSPQLFKDPDCWSFRGFEPRSLLHSSPLLYQLSQWVSGYN